jgi:hypothetical protein
MDRYLLFATHDYSLPILRPLQQAIRSRGGEAAWLLYGLSGSLLREGERLLGGVDQAIDYDPRAVFVPGNWVPHFIPGAKVEVFHGFAIEKKGHFAVRNWVDLYCTPGELTTGTFQELARKHGHFHVIETGWPKMDPLFTEQAGTSWKRDHGVDKPVVLFAPTFSPRLSSAPALHDTIKSLASQGSFHWLVKFHPKMDPHWTTAYRELAGPNLTFVDDPDLAPYLRAADVMLSDTSSAVTEFLMLDKPVVTFKSHSPGEHVLDLLDPGTLPAGLERAAGRPADLIEGARRFTDRMHPYRDGRSSERVLDATDIFIREIAPSLKPKPLNAWRKFKARKRLGYWRPASHGSPSPQRTSS